MTPKSQILTKYDTFIGIDVDKNSYSITVKDRYEKQKSKKMPSEPKQFYNYLKNHFSEDSVLCAYEAGPTGYDLHDYLKKRNQPCFVVSPLSIPKASNERVKNNRIDSEKICKHLKSGELSSIRVPYQAYRELRHLLRMRENYVHNRKAAKQRIKSLLLFTSFYKHMKDIEQNWACKHIDILKTLDCPKAMRQRLDMLLKDLDYARAQTVAILHELRNFVEVNRSIKKNMKYLLSLPGIGFITAITLLGNIGDPLQLKNVRELGAFIGLVPSEKSTGDTVNQGSITHLGNRVLRSLLIEASWSSIRKDRELNQFYHRIKNRHHPKIGSRKAIVAVARKLTNRIHCVLKEQRVYKTVY